MNKRLFRFSPYLSVLALVLFGGACSSSSLLKKNGDAAVSPDSSVGGGQDAGPDMAGRDIAPADLLPDAWPIAYDAVPADVPTSPPDASAADLPACDVPGEAAAAADVPAWDVSPSDLNASAADGVADGPPVCSRLGGRGQCNDNLYVSVIWGYCQTDGTCACTADHVVNPSTGRCMEVPRYDASSDGETGALACTGEYDACGCGCCGGTPQATRCYYPSLGESTASLAAGDLESKTATDCNLAGCGSGIHYVCCAPTAPESPSGATYTEDWYLGSDGHDYLKITKAGADCASLTFAMLVASPNSAFRVATKTQWSLVAGGFGACGEAGAMGELAGAVGTLDYDRGGGTMCFVGYFDVHLTLFTFTAAGDLKTARIDVGFAASERVPGSPCN